ncbi:hypothetical protein D1872_81110 [compost metagenome]
MEESRNYTDVIKRKIMDALYEVLPEGSSVEVNVSIRIPAQPIDIKIEIDKSREEQ